MLFNLDLVNAVYAKIQSRVLTARQVFGRPLTLTEKILYTHLVDKGEDMVYARGKDFAEFNPDRVAMQDATAQMALLQFSTAGKAASKVPVSVHCDHLIQAAKNAAVDLPRAKEENKEVYAFLDSVCKKYGLDFWEPGAGIIHQVVFENYAFPGGLLIGTDSHTVNAGGLGMIAVGVGGADAVDAMAGMPWELKYPCIIGVKLRGSLSGFTNPKDVILKLAGILKVSGGTDCIIEYFGEGAKSISATGKGTICNMGAEVGATCSLFGFDSSMDRYLRATGRAEIADAAKKIVSYLRCDAEVEVEPEKYFDKVIEIDLSSLKPHYNGPFSPDRAFEVGEMDKSIEEFESIPEVSAALIGSCTNSSYEDLSRAASIVKDAHAKGIKPKATLYINPGSETVRATAERDGILRSFAEFGAIVFSNACGPCIGMWARDGKKGEKNSIVHSFNRNFSGRADGNEQTHVFVCSPELSVIASLSGTLLFNPDTDFLLNEVGEKQKLGPPWGDELPENGFVLDSSIVKAYAGDSSTEIAIEKESDRLQKLEPFIKWDGKDILNGKLLLKVKGKCTTDHISKAGEWLKYRGHLENISGNLLIGATNAFNDKKNKVHFHPGGNEMTVPDAAKAYKAAKIPSIVIGDENYGEGSSREHAAMEPRFLGVIAVIAKSFARIHETNLKKQGVLALWFADESDYDKILENDTLTILGLRNFEPSNQFTLLLHHADGTMEEIPLNHTYNKSQWEWFKAGSALNALNSESCK
ncbi:MAG: aconitate hydratase [Fibromonadaceae bacterium]|jgi:aconitate hydratase|nr:aconitate hydratase [Fibromonadaceae bacterium]